MNGATCSDSDTLESIMADLYTCTCAAGYSGDICETDLDECASTPCLHGATCTQGVDSYTCTCMAGYTDVPVGTCFSELDECASAPCMNGSTCTDMVYAYECTCASGWSGGHCELEVDPCPADDNDCDTLRAECIQVGAGT